MKASILNLTLAVALALGAAPNVFADDEIEVAVEAALAPPNGFDDNDNVQVVLHGYLPNSCYELGDHLIDRSTGVVKIRQLAKRRTSTICVQGGFIPEFMMMAVPFTNELALGQLPAGQYQLEFNLAGTGSRRRGLNVAHTAVPGVDSLPYAAITNVIAEDLQPAAQNVRIKLNGLLNSTCTELDQNIRVEKMGDVSVVLPTIRVKKDVLCTQVLMPFSVDLDLGKVAAGHHLVHVRSMSGKSLNRVIDLTN